MFNLGVDIEKINIADEFILSWLMDKISYMEDFKKEEAQEAKNYFFTDYFLDNIIEEDELLFHRMFTFLSPERFTPIMDKILQKWPSWHDLMAYDSAPVMAKLAPSKASELFLSYISGDNSYEDRFKIKGIINSIEDLPEKERKEISSKLIDAFLSSSLDTKEKSHFIPDMMVLAWKYDCKFDLLLKMSDEFRKEPEVFEDFFRSLAIVFTGNDDFYDIFYTGYNWGTEWKFSDTPEFFLPDLSLEEFDEAFEDFFDNKFETVITLFNKYAHLISDEKVRNFIKDVSSDGDLIKDYETEEKVIFYSFIFSSIISSIMVKEVELSGLDIHGVIKLLDFDMKILPSMERFTEFFKTVNKDEAVNLLLEKFDEEHTEYCHTHIISIMGELNYIEFLEPLFENLYVEDDDDVLDGLKDAFFKYQDRFLEYFISHLSDMDKPARITCLEVARRMEEHKFLNFIEKNFDVLWVNNKDFLADVMEIFPKEKFIKKLLPLINKGNFMIDKTCLILAKILDYPLPDMEMMEDKLMEQEERVMKIQESLDDGEPSEFLEPHIYIELKCNECNDESTYKVEHVDVDLSDKENIGAIVKDKISCINCNKQGTFDVTEDGKTVILGRMMFLMTIEDDEVREKIAQPITFVNEPDVDEEDLEEYLLYKIEEEPLNPDNYIYMANHCRNIKKDKKSEEFLKKVLDFEKSYPEVYFALADIYACRRKYKVALEYLEQGKAYLYTGKYRKDFDDMEGFIDAYNQFCDDMSHMCGEKSIEPVKVDKIGRNDPCPCGSGKKYKKCCLML